MGPLSSDLRIRSVPREGIGLAPSKYVPPNESPCNSRQEIAAYFALFPPPKTIIEPRAYNCTDKVVAVMQKRAPPPACSLTGEEILDVCSRWFDFTRCYRVFSLISSEIVSKIDPQRVYEVPIEALPQEYQVVNALLEKEEALHKVLFFDRLSYRSFICRLGQKLEVLSLELQAQKVDAYFNKHTFKEYCRQYEKIEQKLQHQSAHLRVFRSAPENAEHQLSARERRLKRGILDADWKQSAVSKNIKDDLLALEMFIEQAHVRGALGVYVPPLAHRYPHFYTGFSAEAFYQRNREILIQYPKQRCFQAVSQSIEPVQEDVVATCVAFDREDLDARGILEVPDQVLTLLPFDIYCAPPLQQRVVKHVRIFRRTETQLSYDVVVYHKDRERYQPMTWISETEYFIPEKPKELSIKERVDGVLQQLQSVGVVLQGQKMEPLMEVWKVWRMPQGVLRFLYRATEDQKGQIFWAFHDQKRGLRLSAPIHEASRVIEKAVVMAESLSTEAYPVIPRSNLAAKEWWEQVIEPQYKFYLPLGGIVTVDRPVCLLECEHWKSSKLAPEFRVRPHTWVVIVQGTEEVTTYGKRHLHAAIEIEGIWKDRGECHLFQQVFLAEGGHYQLSAQEVSTGAYFMAELHLRGEGIGVEICKKDPATYQPPLYRSKVYEVSAESIVQMLQWARSERKIYLSSEEREGQRPFVQTAFYRRHSCFSWVQRALKVAGMQLRTESLWGWIFPSLRLWLPPVKSTEEVPL